MRQIGLQRPTPDIDDYFFMTVFIREAPMTYNTASECIDTTSILWLQRMVA